MNHHPESIEQEKVVTWLRLQYPYVLFTASTQEGAKNIQTAARRKRMGYRAGTPDLVIYEQRGQYGALFVEIKACKSGVVSESQEDFLTALNQRGYQAAVAHGFNEAIKQITAYLNLPCRP